MRTSVRLVAAGAEKAFLWYTVIISILSKSKKLCHSAYFNHLVCLAIVVVNGNINFVSAAPFEMQ